MLTSPNSKMGYPLRSVCMFVLGITTGANAQLVFTDVSATAGIELPGMLNESLAWGDYDNDGDEDLYLTVDGANKLFRNDGSDLFTDVTSTAGVGATGFSVGCAFGDLDNDGDLDLVIVSFGVGPDVIYRNNGPVGPGGAYTFTDVALAAGVTDESSSRGVALIDYDGDGLLDIYMNGIELNILYHNLGGLTFESVAGSLGVAAGGLGVGVVASDVDNNGWVDLYTGNRSSNPNWLYLNDGGTFTALSAASGLDKVGLGMGVCAFDYDNDLDMDLYWTTWPGVDPRGPLPNALYDNVDGSSFVDVTTASGTSDADGWGISCNTGDIDNDGWEDFLVTNGASSGSDPSVLFLNDQDHTFSIVSSVLGGLAFDGRGVAMADYDNDGDLDICVTGGPAANTRLWRNDTVNSNHWITLKLVGTVSNRSGIGARIEVTTDLQTTVKEVSSGAGRGSFNSIPVEFGLGLASTITLIKIRWPGGVVQLVEGEAMDQILTVTEPDPSIPAASQWGLMALALALLTLGSILMRGRSQIRV